MNSDDKAEIISRYRHRLSDHGEDIKALASGTVERQQLRFGVIAGVGDLSSSSVLDLGCGLADFYAYLKQRDIQVDYTGYDICPDFVERASARFPEATFEVRDIQSDGIGGAFDFIVCSQTFNNRLCHEDNMETVQSVLALCYQSVRRGMAMDMVTSYVDFHEDHLYYFSPEEVFRYCKSLTKRVTLRHDYPLFEFTVYLYKDFEGWRV